METKSYSILDIGSKRKVNEDSLAIFTPENEKQLNDKGSIYIVADGVGGLNKGDVASRTVVETVKTEYYKSPSNDIKESLKYAINKANMKLINMREGEEKLASTLVCAVVKDNTAYIANVGDSRAYLFRNNKLIRKTDDHSFVGERMRMGELTEEEARLHPRKNIILRCLGDIKNLEIDFFKVTLEEKDKLLLCTDGLWGELPHKVMEKTLNTKVESSLENLKKKVYENGANDNIGAILVDIIKLDILKEKVIPERSKFIKIALGLVAGFAVIFLILSIYFGVNLYDFEKPSAKIIINPDLKKGQIPAEFKFDGSTSTDNKEITSYLWSVVGVNSKKTLSFYTGSFTNKFEIPDTYNVKLICIDKYGNQSKEAVETITVEDNEKPALDILLSDASNEYYLGYDKFANFKINVSDNFKLAKVTVSEMQTGKLLKEFPAVDKNWNYSYSYEIKKAGDISLRITAADVSGNESLKDLPLRILKDDTSPLIESITVNGGDLASVNILKNGAVVELRANVKDDKEISKIEFNNGDITLGTVNNAPYKYFWKITEPGEYIITVAAYDKDNNKSTTERKITVVLSGYTVYANGLIQDSEIYIVNLETDKKDKLTNNFYEDINPVLSVNEDLIYFVSKRNGYYELYSMQLNGEEQQQISNFNSINKILILPAINKDDLMIRFENEPDNSLYIFSITDKSTRKI